MPVDEALFKRLAETPGVPGREEQVRRLVREELTPLVDEVRVDALGNVIGTKRGRADVRVMIAAHMDEIGFLVRYIDERGFLRLQPLGGGMGPLQMNAQRVLVHSDSGASLRGALQLGRTQGPPQPGETPSLPRQDEFFVDLGLPAEAVREAVRVGDFVTMDRGFERAGDCYLSKAIDDRVGLLVMLEALRALRGHEATIYAVATVQEEVGLRGAGVSGYALEPTVMIAVDDSPARDYPGNPPESSITRLGGGAAIKIMDGSLICNPRLVRHFRDIAEREEIPHQLEILPFGGTDAGAVQRQRGGVAAITLSIPCRYTHTVNEMASVSDVQACVDLLARYLEEAHTGDYAL
ncbi:MAG TPA: M42 family metallopeptidase [Thermomicrobiaceae bacterium]|nr:M42 family metallopeptidase [Thermomicrobiaceae bacterium]